MEPLLQVAICEDLKEDADRLLDLVKNCGIPSACVAFSSAESFLSHFTPGQFDLIFFDIYLGGMSGVTAAKKIREIDESVTIAFTTTSLEHTLESYRIGAVKYLEKKVKGQEVRETLELAWGKRKAVSKIFIPVEGKSQSISLDTILYMEQQNHRVKVNTISGLICSSQTIKLSDLATMLPCPPFFRCHYSFIVNLHYVRDLDCELRLFTMKDGGKAYIRRQDLGRAKKAYEEELFRSVREELHDYKE